MSFLGLEYVNPAEIYMIREELIERNLGGGKVGSNFGTGRWAIEITLQPQSFENAQHRVSAHRAKHGELTPFNLPMPQIVSTDFPSATFGVGAAAAQGAGTVNLKSSTSMNLPVGRFIKFSNHNKIYQIDGAGVYTVTSSGVVVSIVPNLTVAVGTSHTWDGDSPELRCTYARGSRGFMNVNRRSIVTRSISVEEV